MTNIQQFPKVTIASGDGTGNLATVNSSGQVETTGSGGGGGTANITQVGGVNVPTSPAGPGVLTVAIDQSTPGTTNQVEAVGAGTAGTPSGGVVSVQGVSGGTPVPITGAITTSPANSVSSVNSSTTTLTANSTFTGTSESTLNYAGISIEVFSDVASASGGLIIEQSQDGTNWDTQDVYSTLASTAFQTTISLTGQFYRIVFTNGTTNQTTFRLQTIKLALNPANPRTLTVGDSQAMPTAASSKLVNGGLITWSGTGTTLAFGPIDTLGYTSYTLHSVANGTNVTTIVAEFANVATGESFQTAPVYDVSQQAFGAPVVTLAALVGHTVRGSINGRYMQINTNANQTAGSTTFYLSLHTQPYVPVLFYQVVTGAAASGGSNTGQPVKIGAAFNTTQPTVTNAQAVDIQATARGAQIVATGVDRFDANLNPTAAVQTGWSVSPQNALTTTATVSGAAGKYGGGSFMNLNATPAYIQFFDTTGAVTLGTTAPTFVQGIPANATAANGAAYVFEIANGIGLANGLKAAATTTATGGTTVTTGLTGFITYK